LEKYRNFTGIGVWTAGILRALENVIINRILFTPKFGRRVAGT